MGDAFADESIANASPFYARVCFANTSFFAIGYSDYLS